MLGWRTITPATVPAMMLMARIDPPAWLYLPLLMPRLMAGRPAARQTLRHLVNAPLSIAVRHFSTAPRYRSAHTTKTGGLLSQHVHVPDRSALAEAAELIDRFGDYATSEAKLRADRSRDLGNLLHFCRWRQIERTIAMLRDSSVSGAIH